MLIVTCLSRMRKDVIEPDCARYTSEVSEELLPGNQYAVYGLCLIEDCLLYLIDPIVQGSSRPFWYPSSLFSVCDSRLPNGWHFKQYPEVDYSNGVKAIWGYDQLVHSREHFIGLIEREPKDIELFIQYKDMIKASLE